MSDRSTPLLDNTGLRSAAAVLALAVALLLAYLLGGGRGTAASAAPAVRTGTTASTADSTTGVEVVGTGKIAGTPDVLRLDLAVTITRPSAGDALPAVNTITAKVIATLKKAHVQAKDIKTSGLSLQPQEDYSKGQPVIRGYTATEGISVVLRDLKHAGAVISAASVAGGDAVRINGASLDLDGDSALLAQAREAAVADARTKAEQYAKAAGRSLGTVTVISEQAASTPPPMMRAMDLSAGLAPAAAAVPVEPGSQQVAVTVRVIWSFA